MTSTSTGAFPASLTPVAQAREFILSRAEPSGDKMTVPLSGALGKVLAEAQAAGIDVPGYDNSAMDGYALNTADLEGETPMLEVTRRITAGSEPGELIAGTAARVFTGAPVPEGADAVVIQENTRREGDRIIVLKKPDAGANIRLRGHDITRGREVLSAGHILRPQDLGLLASLGIARVAVRPPLNVAILNTGNEVVPPGETLAHGRIYDSNSFTLEGLLQGMGCRVTRTPIVQDNFSATREALDDAAGQADLLISTGGVSVGEEDHVKDAVQALGDLFLWKLAIKPGKPFAFGRVKQTPFFGLPGNPVAVFVTFAVLVRPYLLKKLGATRLDPPAFPAKADFAIDRSSPREEYIRVRLRPDTDDGMPWLEKYPDQGSSVLTSLAWADGLAIVPADTAVAKGDSLRYIPFKGIL